MIIIDLTYSDEEVKLFSPKNVKSVMKKVLDVKGVIHRIQEEVETDEELIDENSDINSNDNSILKSSKVAMTLLNMNQREEEGNDIKRKGVDNKISKMEENNNHKKSNKTSFNVSYI